MAINALPGILEQAFNRLRGDGKGIGWGRLLDPQICGPRDEESKIEQLVLAIEGGETHATNSNRAIDQILAARDWQLAGVGGQVAVAGGYVDQEVESLFFEPHRMDDAMNLDKLAVFLPAGQLIEGNRQGLRKGPLPQDPDSVDPHNRCEFSLAGVAFEFELLAHLQSGIRNRGLEVKINAGGVILYEAEAPGWSFLIEKGQYTPEAHGIAKPGFVDGEMADLRGGSQFWQSGLVGGEGD
jgi:hypothetical protein